MRSWTDPLGVVNDAWLTANVELRPCSAAPVGETSCMVQVILSPGEAVVGPFIETWRLRMSTMYRVEVDSGAPESHSSSPMLYEP